MAAAVWTSNPYGTAHARAPVHKETPETQGKETPNDLRAWQLSENAGFAAFRFLRARGATKGLQAECMQEAKSEGALAVYALTLRYGRRYGATAVDLDYKRLIRRAKRGVEGYLRAEAKECHETLDAPKHLTLEAPMLSLETQAIIHESLETALGMRLDWPISDAALQWLDARVSAQKRSEVNKANARAPRMSARKIA